MEGSDEKVSNVIDERVVEMRFDNRDFESNVQTSLGTLEKLKSGLNLSESVKGLQNIGNAAKNISLGGLSSGVETVCSRFSALEVIGITALQNITNSAINAGKQMLHSLTIEPVKEGFSEYELKMDSVQTIMNGTGESLDVVMDKLNELNTYADKTIYSFSDMTSSIGKFTNAGVKLDDAVAAIQGVSNLAAVSGANAQQASHAMYNFAQSLSSGSVKLIDWKSIENANMATVEFKNELLKTALELGTVTEKEGKFVTTTTDAKGKVSDAFDAVTGFNDSLSNNWMTTEVLTATLARYSDETTELGKKAFAAAQDVKTFSQLLDTLKEAVGSGWAETWEIVFGNFDEAKELWTGVSNVIGGFIDTQSKARNAILQDWKDLGGRADLIEAIKNIFEGLSSVVKPIGDAMKAVFDPITGSKLAKVTAQFKEFTANFNISEETASKLKTAFQGLFSIFDIGAQAVKALAGFLSPLIKKFPGFGNSVLDVAESLGQWIINLDESIKVNDSFKKGLDNIVSFLDGIVKKVEELFKKFTGLTIGEAFDKVVEKLSNAKDKIQNLFNGFKGIDTSGVESLGKKIQSPFEPLISLFNGMKKLLSGLLSVFQKTVLPFISTIVSEIGKQMGFIGDQFMDAAGNINLDRLQSLINGGLLTIVALRLKDFVSSLVSGVDELKESNPLNTIKEIFEGLRDSVGSVKGIFDGVCESLKTWQQDLKAGTLLKIAGAIAIMTGSIILLTGIEPEKISSALGAMTTALLELLGAMAFIDKVLGDSNSKQLGKLASTMLKISAAMLIFSFAISNIGKLDGEQLRNGLAGIGGILLEIFAFLALTKASDVSKTAGGLIGLGIALNVFAIAVKSLGALPIDQLESGLFAIGALLTELFAFLALTKASDVKKSAGGLIGLGIALNVFAIAVKSLGALPVDQLQNGLLGLGAILLEVFSFLALTKAADVTKSAAGLIGLGIALNVFVSAVGKLGAMSIDQLIAGLVSMSVILAAIVATANLMNGTIGGAAAMLVMAGALLILCPALKFLGSLSLAEIGKSLLALAGAFVVIGVASFVLAPLVPVILALAGAFALLGASVLMIATGGALLAVGDAIGSIGRILHNIDLMSFMTMLSMVFKSIISFIPELLKSIGIGIISIVAVIGSAAPTVMEAVTSILIAISHAIINASPEIIAAAVALIAALLNGIVQLVPAFVEAAGRIMVGFLQGIAVWVPAIVQAGVALVISFINGIAEALRGNAEPLYLAVMNLVSSIVELFITGFQMIAQGIPIIGDTLADGLDTMKDNIREKLAPSDMKDAASDAVGGIASGISSGESKVESAVSDVSDAALTGLVGSNNNQWVSGGNEIVKRYAGGITSSSDVATDAGETVSGEVQTGLESIDFGDIGSESISQYIQGFGDGKGDLNGTLDGILDSANDTLSSGSSQFDASGTTDMSAFVSGMKSKEGASKKAAKEIASSSASAAKSKKGDFVDAGKSMGKGLASGLNSCSSILSSAGKKAAKDALNAAKKELEINSPSRKFARLGAYSGQGFVIGLNSYASRISTTGSSLAENAVSSVRSAINRLADTISSDLDTTPTIRPVLDLSDVRSGAGYINRMLSGNYALGANAELNAISLAMQSNQNGASNDDLLSAIKELNTVLSGNGGTTYNINGITYDDGSNIATAIQTLIRAARVERRV